MMSETVKKINTWAKSMLLPILLSHDLQGQDCILSLFCWVFFVFFSLIEPTTKDYFISQSLPESITSE